MFTAPMRREGFLVYFEMDSCHESWILFNKKYTQKPVTASKLIPGSPLLSSMQELHAREPFIGLNP